MEDSPNHEEPGTELIGVFDTTADLARHLTEDMVALLPEWAQRYFDSEKYLKDLRYNGDIAVEEVDGRTLAYWVR